ncbi:MAG: RNase adapter RapZ [Thermoanaerobaculum sp.]|nr:RNase adapter RapZ [Thermoanaerobaculum sp.]MDW7966961.1 RNase adapter RapZ [Thermoanaerobaculum sp.]
MKEKNSQRAIIVTGLSGAGKSIVTRCFEDLGFTCVDNLPLDLIEPLFERVFAQAGPPWVVVVDVRTPAFAGRFPALVGQLQARFPGVEVLFVEASDDVIVRRFQETRRPHPIRHLDLPEAVTYERQLLQEVRAVASDVLDTSNYTPHELRAEVARRFGTTELAQPLVVRCESFGFKFGLPSDATLVFDVRFLPNPHFVPELRPLPGDHPKVAEWLGQQQEVEEVYQKLRGLVSELLPLYQREQKSYVVVAFGCTGGKHRSVYLASRLGDELRQAGWLVRVHHRDRDREP